MQPSPLVAPVKVLQNELRLEVERYRYQKLQQQERCIACQGRLSVGARLSPDGEGPLCHRCEMFIYEKLGAPMGDVQ